MGEDEEGGEEQEREWEMKSSNRRKGGGGGGASVWRCVLARIYNGGEWRLVSRARRIYYVGRRTRKGKIRLVYLVYFL